MQQDHSVEIAPPFAGLATVPQLIAPEGTLMAVFPDGVGPGIMFRVRAPGFDFVLRVTDDSFEFVRNGSVARAPLGEARTRPSMLDARWTPEFLAVGVSYGPTAHQHSNDCQTPPIRPPQSLRVWAHKASLIPTIQYPSAQLVHAEVATQLRQLNERIRDRNAITGFWDNHYDDRKKLPSTPKHEPHIHPQIESLLFHLPLQRGIEIRPEHPAGSRELDFLFTGRTVDGTTVDVCVEFKKAHATDLAHGLMVQLPEYMDRCRTDYGVYCVLDFGEEYPPNLGALALPHLSGLPLDAVLELRSRDTGRMYLTTVVLDVAPKPAPSKM
jgi:hypothetical protein